MVRKYVNGKLVLDVLETPEQREERRSIAEEKRRVFALRLGVKPKPSEAS